MFSCVQQTSDCQWSVGTTVQITKMTHNASKIPIVTLIVMVIIIILTACPLVYRSQRQFKAQLPRVNLEFAQTPSVLFDEVLCPLFGVRLTRLRLDGSISKLHSHTHTHTHTQHSTKHSKARWSSTSFIEFCCLWHRLRHGPAMGSKMAADSLCPIRHSFWL